jgi:predicted permease
MWTAMLETLVAAVLSGLTPAWQATRRDGSVALKQESQNFTYRKLRLRNCLVGAQVAVSMVLLVGFGLFLKSLTRVWADLGFDPSHVYVASLDFSVAGINDPQGRQFARDLVARVSSLPSVQSASLASDLPLNGEDHNTSVGIPGQRAANPRGWFQIANNAVGGDYFKTMGIPILAGRGFSENDRDSAMAVALISASMAKRFWPDQNPIGKLLNYCGGGCPTTVVGVVGDIRSDHRADDFAVYRPLDQDYKSRLFLTIQTSDAARVMPILSQVLLQMSPDLPIIRIRSLNQTMAGGGLFLTWLGSWVAGVTGSLGVLLAAIGIYSVTAYAASSRQREIGIRTAIGARPRQVLQLMLREGLTLTAIGVVAGWSVSLAVMQLIAGALYGVTPNDTATFVAASAIVAAVALFATYPPARRAARLDPMNALRND